MEKNGPQFDPEEEAAGVHAEVKRAVKQYNHLIQGSQLREDLLEQFASSEGAKAFLEPGVPEVERRASADLKVLEAHVANQYRAAHPVNTFAETWAAYRSALYAIHGTLSTAHSLLHNECMRTPCGSDAWETLRAFALKVNAVSEALQKEIERVPAAGEVK